MKKKKQIVEKQPSKTKKSLVASAATLVGVGAVYVFGSFLKRKL